MPSIFNIFVNEVVKTRSIPFEIKAAPQQESIDALEAFQQIRMMAESGQFQICPSMRSMKKFASHAKNDQKEIEIIMNLFYLLAAI